MYKVTVLVYGKDSWLQLHKYFYETEKELSKQIKLKLKTNRYAPHKYRIEQHWNNEWKLLSETIVGKN